MSKRTVSAFLALTLAGAAVLAGPDARAQANPPAPFELTITTIPAGFATYTIGVGLAEQITKNSGWLKAVHVEGRGPPEHMKGLVKNADRRKNYLFFNSPWDLWEARQGGAAYEGFPFNYEEFGFVFLTGVAADCLVTTNPKIKTLKDIANRRVIFDSGPAKGREFVFNGILEAAGVPLSTLHYQYSSGKAAADTLRDGLVDVAYGGAVLRALPSSWVTSPFHKELVSTKDTYFISFDRESVDKFKQKTGHPAGFARLPPGILGPLQKEAVGVMVKPLGFCAHRDMPAEVVTEILRVVYENAEKLKEYTPMAEIIRKDTLASLGVPESWYHPAALKFFKEKGIKIGSLE